MASYMRQCIVEVFHCTPRWLTAQVHYRAPGSPCCSAQDPEGRTPLDIAALRGSARVVEVLLHAGAPVPPDLLRTAIQWVSFPPKCDALPVTTYTPFGVKRLPCSIELLRTFLRAGNLGRW